ncbi:MAG: excinuclease ABC subunit UvrB [Eubacteriaceae bacterium]|nr:excinuclease ABC subunit UvrB [Eubacteriaceae bacterium]
MDQSTPFKVFSSYEPAGDQPQAIASLAEGIQNGLKAQTLLGVTGSGKTYTIAKVVEQVQKPTLVLAHNKTLAAQLYQEFKAFFPENAVEYFVSYYDYYQPEAYVPGQDLYIEKDSDVNDEIDKMRHSATAALSERKDVLIVASVSCIYGLGSPIDYESMVLSLRVGMIKERDDILRRLIDMQYDRNDVDFKRGTFRAKGDVIEIFPAYSSDRAIRVELFGNEIDRIKAISPISGEAGASLKHVAIYPASHYVTSPENMQFAVQTIEKELVEALEKFRAEGKLVEAQRIQQRTNYDLEVLKEMGYCKGIENYSRHINRTQPGAAPFTLIDYFPDDFLMVIDESHQTLPQVRGMWGGDHSRKKNLVDYGFRLPSAYDNRPLNFEEFEEKIGQTIFVSATPSAYEQEHSGNIAEQIVRPTGLVDPEIEIQPTKGQIDHLIGALNGVIKKGEKALVTTLTKRMAEELTKYISRVGISCTYLHSEIDTVERVKIINDLRSGVYDVIIGINLLREGLDIPEVSLVAILDADKEGFLRNTTSLIQTVGRASRNENGHVIMYADTLTDSMDRAIKETERRRDKQRKYNEEHNVTPTGIKKELHENFSTVTVKENEASYRVKGKSLAKSLPAQSTDDLLASLDKEMKKAAKELDFERAAMIRDRIANIKKQLGA